MPSWAAICRCSPGMFKATTIELAIYQALSFDYDPARAAMLALIQMLCCLRGDGGNVPAHPWPFDEAEEGIAAHAKLGGNLPLLAGKIELAIYQALSFDYDPARAAMLALIQMLCCLGLVHKNQRGDGGNVPAHPWPFDEAEEGIAAHAKLGGNLPASCWRTSFSICRWPPACCCRRWRTFPASSGKLPPSLACAAMREASQPWRP
jgi:hypothetical protein